MEAIAEELSTIANEAREFRDNFKTLQLSTATMDALPTASYAPFVQISDSEFGIYISELAAHTHNLVNNPRASVLFIEPENSAKQLFARKRLVYNCEAILHDRKSKSFGRLMSAMKLRFAGVMDHLEKMQDFHMFTLVGKHASYVKGFAKAYEFNNADLNQIRHINDKGHNESAEQ